MEAPLFIKLDTNWPDNPKVIAAGLDGAGLHASIMCTVKRLETDGVLTTGQVMRLGGTPELIDRLLDVGLLDRVDDDRVAVHGWLDTNRSSAAIQAERRAKRASGMRGNHKRWGHPGPVEKCPMCMVGGSQNPSHDTPEPSHNGRSSQGATPTDSHPRRTPESGGTPTESPETETETETETISTAAARTTTGPNAERGGGGTSDLRLTAAARLVAETECARRQAQGDTIGNPAGYVRSRVKPITADHEQAWRTILDTEPDATPQRLADSITQTAPQIVRPPAAGPQPPPIDHVRLEPIPVETSGNGIAAAKAALRTRQPAPIYDEAPF